LHVDLPPLWQPMSIGDSLLDLRGSGGDDRNKAPENKGTQNGKAAASYRDHASFPEQ